MTSTTQALLGARRCVIEALLLLEKKKHWGYQQRFHLDEALAQAFSHHHLDERDQRFASAMAYQLVSDWFLFSHWIQATAGRPLKAIEPIPRLLIKLGLVQLLRMNQVPDYAAISSTLTLAEGFNIAKPTRGFINALLNKALREGVYGNIATTSEPDAIAPIQEPTPETIEHYFPKGWIEYCHDHYSPEACQSLFLALKASKPLVIRVNTLKTSMDTLIDVLRIKGVAFERYQHPSFGALSNELLILPATLFKITDLPGFSEGWFVIQNPSAAAIAHHLNPQPGETILEIGAAPGTKTAHLAQLMQNQGTLWAVDISATRMKRVIENTQRLGLSNITPVVSDALKLDPADYQADRVLLDAPCSATGVSRKHPEVLITWSAQHLPEHQHHQRELLVFAWQCLKPGGTLVYSTCSLCPDENQGVVEPFLQTVGDSVSAYTHHVQLPDNVHDGFYSACLTKATH